MEGIFPVWTWVIGFYIGAAIGSFLNVVIYRLPLGLSIGKPKHSFCPNCKKQLGIQDLVPIFSWLFLKGKCRQCGVRVSPRYMVVELITGILFAAIWHQNLVAAWDPIRAVVLAAASAALVCAICIDLQYYIIPDQVNAFIFIVGVLYNIALIAQNKQGAFTAGIPSSLVGAFVGFAVFWGITLLGRLIFQKDAMGHGDIKLARGIGAVLFAEGAAYSFALAIVLGAVLGVVQILARGRQPESEGDQDDDEAYEPESIASIFKCGLGYLLLFDIVGLMLPKFSENWFGENPYSVEEIEEEPVVGQTMIPFGPYLAMGAILVIFFQPTIHGWWESYLHWVMPPSGG